MSLFKRKQSKDKEAPIASTATDAIVNSPPVAAVAQMASMRPGQSPYGPGIVSSPMASGRRMTSNPMPMGNGPMNGHPGSQSTASLPPQFPTQDAHPNGLKSPQQPYTPGGGGPQQHQASTPGHQRQSSFPNATYPWSTRPLRLYSPQTNPPSAPLSPFPRYGLSVPAFPSHSGHILIFGGLVEDSVKNDLWSMDVRDCTTMPVKTKGDAPLPRVGHASAMADRIMLVWGGDTKVKVNDPQDESLYILDLRTQEWTRLPVAPGPVGRYGHAACMHDSRFYVFGGQAEAEYMNDLWAYDIKQLSTDGPQRWERVQFTTPAPPRRTGHVLTSHQGKLYLFGGTDGSYHYNDTWSFDLATGAWTELSCIGYIPVPREGHAAAVIDDVMYIFGGRDVNGKDLGDLAAFRITNQRWYMFQNMGPAPTARSGHAMVAAHGKIFVVGGEANASSPQIRDDPSVVHVLDTGKIKYPTDAEPPRQLKPRASDAPLNQQAQQAQPAQLQQQQQQQQQRQLQQQAHQAQAQTQQAQPPSTLPNVASRSVESTPRMPHSGSADNLARAASPNADRQLFQTPQMSQQSHLGNQQSPPPPILAAPVAAASPRSESHDVPPRAAPPQRPRREGDEEYRRAMSPQNVGASPTHPGVRVTSPNGYSTASPPATRTVNAGVNAGVLGTRSPSPRLRDAERPAPPPDAFYYGRSPTSNGFNPNRSSMSGSADHSREVKAKDTEIELGKKREAALRAIIGKATAAGFVLDDEDAEAVEGGDASVEGDGATVQKLVDALVRLKREKASIANDLAAQVQIASDRAAESDRLRRGALQEAAFFRAKAATLESNSPVDLHRIEKERINELERQLGALHAEHATVQRDFERHKGESLNARDLHSTALQREQETLKRAEDAEEAHRLAIEEMEELQERLKVAEAGLREHSERSVTLASAHQQREAERDRLQARLDEALATHDHHLSIIEQAQASLATHGTRSAELEGLHGTAKERVAELEKELAQTRFELESAQREAQAANERIAEVESSHSRTREEAESLRGISSSRIGELLDSHRSLREDTTRGQREHEAQVRALEEEANALRKMLREAGQRLDAAESGVHTHRQKSRELEAAHHSLRSELRSHQTKLITAQQELTRHRDLHTTREAELRGRDDVVTELETRCATLRNLLAEHGIAVSDDDIGHKTPGGNGSVPASREMETMLRDKTRAHDDAQRKIEELSLRCTEAENRVESLTRLMEQVKGARSPTMSTRSPSPGGGDTDRRIIEAERKIQEMETVHKEKMAALEGDYQTAVRYVKGTEKMLKRMKDELNKQKSANTALQAEMDGITGRSSAEPGARTREVASGRATPSSYDPELTRRNEKLQGQLSALQAELSASRGVLQAREREVEVLRMRVEESDREAEILRDDLAQSQHRINTLLGTAGYGLGSDDERRLSLASSVEDDDEATMSYDKFSKELKQWERSRSPDSVKMSEDDDKTQHAKTGLESLGAMIGHGSGVAATGHRRGSSEYSTEWTK